MQKRNHRGGEGKSTLWALLMGQVWGPGDVPLPHCLKLREGQMTMEVKLTCVTHSRFMCSRWVIWREKNWSQEEMDACMCFGCLVIRPPA